MIYDCFTFFNELDLLEIRLNVLKDVVDRFVLVEAGETHTGKPKPLHFKENEARFAAFKDKIVYIGIDKFPAGHDAWWNENYQRNEIMKGLKDAADDDWVMISDLDEIPDPAAVRQCTQGKGVYQFREKSFGFYLNMLDVRTPYTWGTKLLTYHDLRTGFDGVETFYNEFLPQDLNAGTTVTKIRRREFPASKGGEMRIKAGWHFTCLGGARAILTKMRAVAPHHDFNPDDASLTEDRVAALLAQGKGPALKMNCFGIPVENAGLPSFLRANASRYPHLVFDCTPEYVRITRWSRIARTMQGQWIAFCLRLCPAALLNQLHLIKMRLLKK